MSELLDKQVYVQIKILKISQGSHKPMKKVCDENGSKKKKQRLRNFFWWKEEFIRLYQKSGWTDFNELQDTISTLNEDTNSLVTSESEPDGWFVMHRCKTSAIKFAMAGSHDWWCRFPQSLVYRFYIVKTY